MNEIKTVDPEVETVGLSGRWLRYDHALLNTLNSEQSVWNCLDAQTPALAAHPVTLGGRAAAWFVQVGSFSAVLRHYRRGGWIAKLIKDRYFWLDLKHTRAFSEFDLMRLLWRAGFPVPRPLGAAVWKKGLTYRAALLTERIANAQPLALTADPSLWHQAGVTIAEMHRLGVWHADLNVYNILWDEEGKVWLIDFDRGRLGPLSDAQRAANLSRLLRSFKKMGVSQEQRCWSALLEGYQHTQLAPEHLK